MVIPIFVIGLIASIVTELIKLFPVLSKTDERKKLVSFVVAFVIALAYLSTQDGNTTMGITALIVGAMAASFAVYKGVVQPIREGLAKIPK